MYFIPAAAAAPEPPSAAGLDSGEVTARRAVVGDPQQGVQGLPAGILHPRPARHRRWT